MSADPCQQALTKFAQKDFAAWRGLPASCTLSAVTAVWSLEADATRVIVGSGKHVTHWRVGVVEGYQEPVTVWYRDDKVVKISVRYPQLSDVEALLAGLGRPPLELDYYFATVPMLNEGGEWVFADRGLTLLMSSNKTNIIEVHVYPATTGAQYEQELHYLEAPRELD